MEQIAKKTFARMNQDVSKYKVPEDTYYEATDIRITSNNEHGNVTSIKDIDLKITFPDLTTEGNVEDYITETTLTKDISGFVDGVNTFEPLYLLGTTEINNILYAFVKYNYSSSNYLVIYKINASYDLEIKFIDEIEIENKRLDIKIYYESENNIKIYWADGVNPLRFINVGDIESVNLNKNFISTVPEVTLTQPLVNDFTTGASHTSGMIQYAYNLYNKNKAQTKISPLSNLIPLNNGNKGNQIDEKIDKAPIISLTDLDTNFNRIRIYSVKYNSLNATPEVKIIKDIPLTGTSLTITDSNTNVFSTITLDEFLFLGGDTYIPEHLAIKDNTLFLGNYKTTKRDVDFDTRAYSYNSSNFARLEDSTLTTLNIGNPATAVVPETFDCINPTVQAEDGDTYSETYIYPYNDTTVRGGTGPNVRYKFKRNTKSNDFDNNSMSSSNLYGNVATTHEFTTLKTGERYRMFIEFLFNDGSWSFPKWVADFKVPVVGDFLNSSNTSFVPMTTDGAGRYIYIETELLDTPDDSTIIGWRTAMVERTEENKSVVSQGLVSTTIKDNASDVDYIPSYVQRTVSETDPTYSNTQSEEFLHPKRMNYVDGGSPDTSWKLSMNYDDNGSFPGDEYYEGEILADYNDYEQSDNLFTIITPETIFNDRLPISSGRIRRLGYLFNSGAHTSRSMYDTDLNLTDGIYISSVSADLQFNNFSRLALDTDGKLFTGTGLGFSNADQEESITRVSKLIGDNADKEDESDPDNYAFSKQQYFFTRYFSGYTSATGERVGRSVDGRIALMRPSSGIINVPRVGASPYTITSQPSIQIKYNSTVYNSFNYKMGTCIVMSGLNLNVGSNFKGILSSDASNLTNDEHYGVMVEFYRDLPNQYGGNTYEARQLNTTIPYSGLRLINQSTTTVHMGDTFIQRFNAVRTTKADIASTTQITEVVSFPVETTLNLDLRYDLLKNTLTNYDTTEENSYGWNEVYNQQNNTIINVTKPADFEETSNFPNSILPSKTKINNELIDSFTDFLINDKKDLDGTYGALNGFGEYNDNIYSFQDKAIAYLAINPRVQLSASDGIPIELGTGRLIERYQYLTTNSGSLNKWSIVKTKNGLSYFDWFNSSVNFLGGQGGSTEITTALGMKSFLDRVRDLYGTQFKENDSIAKNNVHSIYDNLNEELLITFNDNTEPSFNSTLVYNTLLQSFTSFYTSAPSMYISFENELYSTGTTLNKIYKHYEGEYLPFNIMFIVSDFPENNKIWNNIHFNSQFLDLTNQGFFPEDGGLRQSLDLSKVTINQLLLFNEYQNTNNGVLQTLDLDSYISSGKRRLRKWNFVLPRQSSSRNRLNSPWLGIKLGFDKSLLISDYQSMDIKGILNDVLLTYTPTKN